MAEIERGRPIARAVPQGSRVSDADRADLLAALRALDLTDLEPSSSERAVARLCARARQPDPARADVPAVAAVCVLPRLVATARRELGRCRVRLATVAGAFPSGRSPVELKVAEAAAALRAGADEVDLTVDRASFLAGDADAVRREVAAVRAELGAATLKAILETAELADEDAIRRAARVALAAGADMVKTSTGKAGGATPAAVRWLLEEASAHELRTGRTAGVKASGGIRKAEDAIAFVRLARELRGEGGTEPDRFRLGASSLLDDLVARLR